MLHAACANFHRQSIRRVCVSVALVLCIGQATTAQGQDVTQRVKEAVQRIAVPEIHLTDGTYVRAAFREVVEGPSQWTVRVKSDGKDAALGTVVGPDGWIITKASLLTGKLECQLKDGRKLDAQVVGLQKDFDLAMLKVEARGLPIAEWGTPNTGKVGQMVAAPGLGQDPVAVGTVSVDPRTIPKQSGILGVMLEEDQAGPKVIQVLPGSGAASAGIQVNDIVTHCNGRQTKDRETLVMTVRKYGPGDRIELTLQRDGKEKKIQATLTRSVQGSKPDRRTVQNNMGSKLSDRRYGFPSALQHDTVLRPQDCGGPLVDLDGKVVGINIARAGRTETFAVPTHVVLNMMYDLMSGKLAPPDSTQPVSQEDTEEMEIMDMVPAENPAEPSKRPEQGAPPEPPAEKAEK
jgi:serine protease Do